MVILPLFIPQRPFVSKEVSKGNYQTLWIIFACVDLPTIFCLTKNIVYVDLSYFNNLTLLTACGRGNVHISWYIINDMFWKQTINMGISKEITIGIKGMVVKELINGFVFLWLVNHYDALKLRVDNSMSWKRSSLSFPRTNIPLFTKVGGSYPFSWCVFNSLSSGFVESTWLWIGWDISRDLS